MGTWTPGPGATSGDDLFTGDGTDEIADGDAGNDTLLGAGGNDVLIGGVGDDVLDGGDGSDTLTDTSSTTGVADIDGGAGDDEIFINTAQFTSGVIDGGDGFDVLWGGNALLSGVTVQNVEALYTSGNLVTATASVFESFDTIQYSELDTGLAVQLTLAAAGAVDLADELLGRAVTFAGSSGADTITTSNGADSINGLSGDDTLNGGLGDDTLTGGAGDDGLNGGDGADMLSDTVSDTGVAALNGGAGDDTIQIGSAAFTSGVIDGGDGFDALSATGGVLAGVTVQNVETLYTQSSQVVATAAAFESFDAIQRSAADAVSTVFLGLFDAGTLDLSDELLGRSVVFDGSIGADVITTSNGHDQIEGYDGDDTLNGGLGHDALNGGSGDDVLNGGDGDDQLVDVVSTSGVAALSGGAGDDIIQINDAMSAGSIQGGAGSDLLQAYGELGALSITGVEQLATSGQEVIATAAQFEAFDTIFSSAPDSIGVLLRLAAAGTVDLSDELLGRGAEFTGTAGADTITLSNGVDTIFGLGGNDVLNGGGGHDFLTGGGGVDQMYGGAGNDVFYTTAAHFMAGEVYDGGAGTNTFVLIDAGVWNMRTATVVGFATLSLSSETSLSGVHQVDLEASQVGPGLSLTAMIVGDSVTDDLIRVFMDAGGGALSLAGWSFSDWNTNDTLDRIVVIGSSEIDDIVGSRSNDELRGGAGNDVLEGGRGNDVLNGGGGNDTASYASTTIGVIVGLTNYATYNTVGAGIDVIISIENLLGSAFEDVLIGNSGVNVLTGGAGDDTLIGLGGADILNGGAGMDAADYSSATARVRVDVGAGMGFDNQAQGDVLNSIEIVIGSDFADQLTGSAQGDELRGEAGNDLLDGAGGDDVLVGGEGADTYYVDSAGDVVVERGPDGTDRVFASADHVLALNVENLTLIESGDIGGRGNALSNIITGNAGDNLLEGRAGNDTLKGGDGADTLVGGSGADNFVFNTPLGAGNVDAITDFSAADDTIRLSDAIFGLGTGTLAASAFRIGASAADASDRIIYDSATGALYYDADGVGGAAQIQFATLSAGLALTNADFFGVG